jgi:hypothetical protein
MIKQYELLDEDHVGNQLIKLTSNEYSGIIYTYGRVRLLEEDDQLRVQFEYDVQENPVGVLDPSKFRNHIGDILNWKWRAAFSSQLSSDYLNRILACVFLYH